MELEFEHEFIKEMQTFILTCVRRLNKGHRVTLTDINEKLVQANMSKVQLSVYERAAAHANIRL